MNGQEIQAGTSSHQLSEEFELVYNALLEIPADAPDVIQRIENEIFLRILLSDESIIGDVFRQIGRRFKIANKELKKLQDRFENCRQAYRQAVPEFKQKEEIPIELMAEAMDRLRSPRLFDIIPEDCARLGLVGEKENIMLLYLVMKSVKMLETIHAVIFGTSAGGKSSLAKILISLLPDEAQIVIGSASTRAFEYMEPASTKGRVICVLEFEGMKTTLDALRTIMSDKNATRAVVIQEPRTKLWVTRLVHAYHEFCLITTTTRPFLQTETANRMFLIYIDQKKEHLRQVGEQIKARHKRSWKETRLERERIVKIHQAMHKLLKPLAVDIPFAQLIEFPSTSARHNRDLEKFLMLIEGIALLRQFQKIEADKVVDGYIEADIEDYRIAFKLLPYALSEAFEEVSKPDKEVLKMVITLCDAEASEAGKDRQDCTVTTRALLEYAKFTDVDIGDQTKVGQILKNLEFHGLVDCVSGRKQGSRGKYALAVDVRLDKNDTIIGITPSLRSHVTTPEELERRINEAGRTEV